MNRAIMLLLAVLLFLAGSTSGQVRDRGSLRWVRTKPIIDSIVIEGNSYFTTSEIKHRMYSKQRNLWSWLKGDRRTRVQRETLGRDSLEIKYLYYLNGFLGVRLREEFEILPPDSTALVRMTISEGKQLHYGSSKLAGSFDKDFGHRLTSATHRLKEGKPINLFDLRAAEFDMKTFLANGGYPYATVNYLIDTTENKSTVPITFHIESDSLVRFGTVTIEGAKNFPEYAARRELKVKPGATYRRVDILDSQTRLLESGFFSTFQLVRADTLTDRLQPDFRLSVRERKPLYISFHTGAQQSQERDLQWEFSTAFGKRNFLGTRRLELATDYSFSVGSDSRLLTHKYRFSLSEPWFLGFRIPVALAVEVNPKIKDPTQDFDKSSWVVAVSSNKRIGRQLRIVSGLEYQSVEISGVPEDQIPLIKQQSGNSARRKLYFNIRRDSRDDFFIPQRGSVTEFSSDFFGGFLGGDESFFKIEGSWSRYQRFWPGWIAATRIKGGWVEEFGESQFVPSDELLFVGGANTIRGFRENTLGPLLPDGDPKGARLVFIFNQEFRWKTIQVLRALPMMGSFFKNFPLYQSIFVDIGNGFDSRKEIELDNLAYTYGTGIQIASPAGPVRLDYARRIKTDRFDFASRWHFTILYAF